MRGRTSGRLKSTLTLLLEIVKVEVGYDEVAVLLDGVLVPLLEAAGEHHDDFLLGWERARQRWVRLEGLSGEEWPGCYGLAQPPS